MKKVNIDLELPKIDIGIAYIKKVCDICIREIYKKKNLRN